MNLAGKRFKEDIQVMFKQLPDPVKRSYEKPSESRIYERLMRLGIEHRVFQLEDTDEDREIAILTLKEDFIKRYERNH